MRITGFQCFAALLSLAITVAAQSVGASPSTPADVVRSIQTVHVTSKTGLAKAEMLEGALQKKKEFDDWGWVVMERGRTDLEIEIGYQPMTFYYTYRAVHPGTGMVIASNKLVAFDGPDAARKIASDLINRVKKLRGPEAPKNPQQAGAKDKKTP